MARTHLKSKKGRALCNAPETVRFVKTINDVSCKNCRSIYTTTNKPSGTVVTYRILAIDKFDAKYDFIIYVPAIRGKKIRETVMELSEKNLPHSISEVKKFWFGSPTNPIPKEFYQN